jgi:uncharacterized membrane protein SpoIIM required for sporulation
MENENAKWVLLVVVVSLAFGILNMQFPILGSLLVGCIGGITGRILWETGK